MTVSSETEWLLVACGLIAHADDVLDGNEVERLMAMVDDRIPEDAYADWLRIIGDKAELEARYAALPDPPEDQHRSLLEEAWAMAMVDGERNTKELVVLARIAERFGVEPMQLEFWREAWTSAEQEFSVRTAELAALALGGGETLFEDDHSPFLDLIERLPTTTEERERLGQLATSSPTDADALGRALAAMPKTRRQQAFTLVSQLVRYAVEAEPARERFVAIGRAAGLLNAADLL
ncbi:Tellurite resistance protein TerB [Enhygromyxa salina]|uniref:Tellurite resistance protein TerB n=1 Tax=Enhygromyxa salina TaxID=215803 RepID=A0A2S9XBU1_9BACT|nr:TerB family tellurite resistance protein [Enhygromyxa salina]PRP90334.1 Tellurite resistance protein TerB [Enhygromyxa salina]